MADGDAARVVAPPCDGKLLPRRSTFRRLVPIPGICPVRWLFVIGCPANGDAAPPQTLRAASAAADRRTRPQGEERTGAGCRGRRFYARGQPLTRQFPSIAR